MPCRKCPRPAVFAHAVFTHAVFAHAVSALALTLILAGIAPAAHAQGGCLTGGSGGCTTVPEINAGTLTQTASLLTGVGLWLHSRRKR